MTLEAQTFANWSGIAEPPGSARTAGGVPIIRVFQHSTIPWFPPLPSPVSRGSGLGPVRSAASEQFCRTKPIRSGLARRQVVCGTMLTADSRRKGPWKTKPISGVEGHATRSRQSRSCGDGCRGNSSRASTDKRVCPWHPRLHPARTYGKQSQFPQWRAADCCFRGGGRWRILISLMDAGRCGVENRPVRLQWSGPGTACPAFGRM